MAEDAAIEILQAIRKPITKEELDQINEADPKYVEGIRLHARFRAGDPTLRSMIEKLSPEQLDIMIEHLFMSAREMLPSDDMYLEFLLRIKHKVQDI
jgi:hypothetical protein